MQLIRHATVVLSFGKVKILVDPMLSSKGAMNPVGNASNEVRIPMVDLPISDRDVEDLIKEVDAIAITHTHRDHWDSRAQEMTPKDKPIFCQPADKESIKSQGFTQVLEVNDSITWKDINIHRTGGTHGTGEIGQLMGEVSGFVFDKDKKIYVAGDTVWTPEVQEALDQYEPDMTILNTGGAQFLKGDPITMTPNDVLSVQGHMPATKIVAVHMDTVNHCLVKRTDLEKVIVENELEKSVYIPGDGEVIKA